MKRSEALLQIHKTKCMHADVVAISVRSVASIMRGVARVPRVADGLVSGIKSNWRRVALCSLVNTPTSYKRTLVGGL